MSYNFASMTGHSKHTPNFLQLHRKVRKVALLLKTLKSRSLKPTFNEIICRSNMQMSDKYYNK